ncbi:MAG TPA: rhodanese-like domain-containing protein [Candidatus Binataceae bacterium]|nr:rhodanese-like domain-containing protein [Candidatus Binataceae bacterium]
MLLPLWILFLIGCGSDSGFTSSPSSLSSAYVIAAEQLPAALRQPGIVLLSAQSALEVSQPGFVNNAVALDVDAITALGQTRGAFTNYSGWASLFGALGITGAQETIVYDDGEMKFASRARFLLAYFGVRQTFIVNGGYNALLPLIQQGLLTTTPPATPRPVTFSVNIQNNPIHLVFQQDVAAALGNPSVALIDVRTPAEYDGCLLLPGITRGGHIPEARNLPVADLLTPQQDNPQLSFLDSPPELLAIFDNFGLYPNQQIIVYCQDGAKSSLAATALIDAGYSNVSLYYLSYLDWQENPTNPVESVSPCTGS